MPAGGGLRNTTPPYTYNSVTLHPPTTVTIIWREKKLVARVGLGTNWHLVYSMTHKRGKECKVSFKSHSQMCAMYATPPTAGLPRDNTWGHEVNKCE